MQHYFNTIGEIKLEELLVIGLMSGTSLDGVDAALVRISPSSQLGYDINDKLRVKTETLSTIVYPYDTALRSQLNTIIEEQNISIPELCQLNFKLGELYAEAAIEVSRSFGISISQVDLIGSHGQTIYHIPRNDAENHNLIQSTLQIGEASIIAQRTGITTISDFRPRDIAAGGEGAPLISFSDVNLLSSNRETRLVQNIGGLGNVTVLPHNAPPYAFDTGPGNTLIDHISRDYYDKDFDEDGAIAATGTIYEDWVDNVINDEPYFSLLPPKSTGRELFNQKYIFNILNKFPLEKPEDIMANFTALTAKTIAKAYKDFVLHCHLPACIILGGGGARNIFMVELLDSYLDRMIPIKSHEDFGIPDKFKEAIGFALLAYASYLAIPNNVPSCTGASENVILGKIIPGNIHMEEDYI